MNLKRATMTLLHSHAFREQALVKVYSRGARDIASVAFELNINLSTLKGWMRDKNKRDKSVMGSAVMNQTDRRPQDWKPEEQLMALMQTHGLTEEQRNAWCRQQGLFPHHLVAWQREFSTYSTSSAEQEHQLRGLKDENQQLKRELNRKEKALAEAAALLVLQKKFRAMWEDEAK
jgi:Transposase